VHILDFKRSIKESLTDFWCARKDPEKYLYLFIFRR